MNKEKAKDLFKTIPKEVIETYGLKFDDEIYVGNPRINISYKGKLRITVRGDYVEFETIRAEVILKRSSPDVHVTIF